MGVRVRQWGCHVRGRRKKERGDKIGKREKKISSEIS